MSSVFILVFILEYYFFIGTLQQENLALRKNSVQSNTYAGYYASRANDGDLNTCSIASISPDARGFQAYWQVDLGNLYNVDRVALVNINFDQESKFLSNFVILVDQNPYTNPTSYNLCATYSSNVSIPTGGRTSFVCGQGAMRGRYVTIKRMGGFRPDGIALCEFSVYAFVDPKLVTNLALNRPAQQSRTFSNYLASRATDGVPSTCTLAWAGDGSTELAYWQVDLGSVVAIMSVVILNSPNAFESSFLTNFTILVGSTNAVQYDGSNFVCYSYYQSTPVAANRYFTAPCVARGRYLTVRRMGGYRADALSICEFYVPLNDSAYSTRSTVSTVRPTRSPLARGCYANEYSCVTSGRCVPRDWLCDGIKDCAYTAEDESDANCGYCGSDEVRCKNGRQCVKKTNVCDGYSNCQDGSDEEGCVSLDTSATTSDTRIVWAKYRNQEGYQFCSSNWNNNKNDDLCKKMGYSSSFSASYEKASSLKFLDNNYQSLDQCSNNFVIALKCKSYECGARSDKISDVGQYIVNGDLAKQGAWPWQIYFTVDGSFWCGGSIINANWILTAAHCVKTGNIQTDPSRIVVVAGSINRLSSNDNSRQRLYVNRIIVHPQNDNYYLRYDFALMRLSYPIYWSDYVRPICLPSSNPILQDYKLCVATGFGRTSYVEGASPLLRQGRMNLIHSKDLCVDNLLSMTRSISRQQFNSLIDYSNMICAGSMPTTNNANICHGDSGGPLACQDKSGKWTLIGVTSHYFTSFIWPNGCLNSVFGRVPTIVPWIQSYI